VVYARLGDRLRIAAMVDIGYDGDQLRPERIQALKKIVTRSFPELQGLRMQRPGAVCALQPRGALCLVVPGIRTCG
jgi:D-amino-acid dehydrogenase